MKENPNNFLRLLIIEDNPQRIELFTEWVPADIKPVFAKSAGRAIGLLKRDRGLVYAGVMLDRDLNEQPVIESERWLSTNDFMPVLIDSICLDVPVLVHSMNMGKAKSLVRELETAGFWVTRIPMVELTRPRFEQRLEDVREIWSMIGQ
ncbi:MAG: hypothetical protein ACRERU_16560 [Methylococcales bacterium]